MDEREEGHAHLTSARPSKSRATINPSASCPVSIYVVNMVTEMMM